MSVGAPVPPYSEPPQAVIEPSSLIAANAAFVEKMVVYPASVGSP